MEAMTSEREAFEKWALEYGWPKTATSYMRNPTGYDVYDLQKSWKAWQARAHLAQPAQAVDVDTVREVIAEMEIKAPRVMLKHVDSWAERLTRALSVQKAGTVGDEPDVALLASMATCLHHGFGLLDAQQQQSMLHDMRKLWDEVMGRGYYRPENRDRYLAYLASPTPGKEGA